MLPKVAVIVVVPVAANGVAFPLEAIALLMVATDASDELHVTDVVRFWVELSEKVPVAVNCSVVPRVMTGFAGVTARDTSDAEVTVRTVEPDTLPVAAVIFVAPGPIDEAFPLEPVALLIVATDRFDELHVTDVVISCWVPSEKIPVALNCWVAPRIMPELTGVTRMYTGTAVVTIMIVELEMLPDVAVIVVEPAAAAVAIPPAAMVAAAVFDELHFTDVVISCWVPSEKVPVAVNCSIEPTLMIRFAGVTAMDTSVVGVTLLWLLAPQPATSAIISRTMSVLPDFIRPVRFQLWIFQCHTY